MNVASHEFLVGTFQPFTENSLAEIERVLSEVDSVTIGVRANSEVGFVRVRQTIMAHFVMKVLVCGLSGSGKTTLCNALAPLIGAIHLNNDAIRDGPHKALGWSLSDRILHAATVGQWADMLTQQAHMVLVDMICPTNEARSALGPDYTVFVDTISESKYPDTDDLFEVPVHDFRVKSQKASMWARMLHKELTPRVTVMPLPEGTKVIDID